MINKGYIYSVASVLIMSLTPILNKLVMGLYSPILTAFYFSLFSMVLCFIPFFLENKKIIKPNRVIIRISIVNTFGVICQFISLKLLSAATFGFIGRFYIVFSILLSILILKEKITRQDILAIIICIAGSLFVTTGDFNFSNMIGTVFGLLYTFLFAYGGILTKQNIKIISINSVNFYNQASATLILALFMLFSTTMPTINVKDAFIILISAFCSGYLGIKYYYAGMKYLTMSKIGIIRALSPIIVVIYAVIVFNEKITWQLLIGGAFIIFAVILMNWKPKGR